MKSLLLAVAFILAFTVSLSAQEQRHYDPVPEAIIGEWRVLKPVEGSKFESISFYASGLLNIDTKASKMVINYKVIERPEGYEVFISGMSGNSSSSFFIRSVEGNNMQITIKNNNSSKSFDLVKSTNIPYGIIPLQNEGSDNFKETTIQNRPLIRIIL